MLSRALKTLSPLLGALVLTCPAHAAGDPSVAALQAALRARGFYGGAVDGVRGPQTTRAVRTLQARAGLAVDGVAGPRTRRVLGRLGRPRLGGRVLARHRVGWDVVELQFLLAWHGFPSGVLDGGFGPRTDAAVRRFQRWAGLAVDGKAGPATIASLRAPPARCPLRLAWPIPEHHVVGDRFGPRGARFHEGIDIPALPGTPVEAASAGRVAWAGWRAGGWGILVVIVHSDGVRTMYAHLSAVDVRVGQRVALGTWVGTVGSTGDATGPHLHFEVRVRGAAVDPLSGLPSGPTRPSTPG